MAVDDTVRLVVIQDGKKHEIRMGQELTIGRAYSNLLRLDSEEISRVHSVIFRRESNFILRDLDSKNGVLLNGQRINVAQLNNGDHIQIGKFLLIFSPTDSEISGIAESPAPINNREIINANRGDTESSMIFSSASSTDENIATYLFRYDDIFEMLKTAASGQNDIIGSKLASFYTKIQDGNTEERTMKTTVADILLKNLAFTLHATRGAIIMLSQDGKTLTHNALYPYDREIAVNRIVLQKCLRQGYCIVCKDVRDQDEFKDSETIRRDSVRSIIATPIKSSDSTIGLLYLDTVTVTEDFEREDLVVALAVSKLFSLYLTNS